MPNLKETTLGFFEAFIKMTGRDLVVMVMLVVLAILLIKLSTIIHKTDQKPLKNMKTRDLCMLSMFIGITCILAYFSIRVGNVNKYSLKFLPIYVSTMFYGPVAGGVVAVIADVISFFQSGGTYLPIFTMLEFINGILYFVFLGKSDNQINKSKVKVVILAILCVVAQLVVNTFRTYELSRRYFGGHFTATFVSRFPGMLIMAAVQVAIIIMIEPYIPRFSAIIKKK